MIWTKISKKSIMGPQVPDLGEKSIYPSDTLWNQVRFKIQRYVTWSLFETLIHEFMPLFIFEGDKKHESDEMKN